MFCKRMGAIHKRARERLEELREANRAESERLLNTFGEVLAGAREALGVSPDEEATGLLDASDEVYERAGRLVLGALAEAGGVAALSAAHEAVSAHLGNNYLPLDSTSPDDIAEYAGRLYDYHRQHPKLVRLLQWEALTFDAEVPEEQSRREYYGRKTSALADGQAAGTITSAVAPNLLHFLLLSLVGYWAALPQVARMITGTGAEDAAEDARRRACVVEAARRLVSAPGQPDQATPPTILAQVRS